MGNRQRLTYWAKKCIALLLVFILFALVGIIASQPPRSSYAQTHAYSFHSSIVLPTDTTTAGATPNITPTLGITPTAIPTPTATDTPTPTPIITPINQGTPTPTVVLPTPTPTPTVAPPTPTPTPGTQGVTPTPTAVGSKVPTPTPTASGAGGFVPPGGGAQQATPGPGTPTPTPGPSPSPTTPGTAAATVPTSAATAIPTTTSTTQGQQSSGASSSTMKVALGLGAVLLLAGAALGIVMWKRQTNKNIRVPRVAIPLPTFGQQSGLPWMNRSEVEAAFRTSVPPTNDYAMYNQQNQQQAELAQLPPAMVMAMAEASANPYGYAQEQGAYAQANDAQNFQDQDQSAQGSRLLSQARAAQRNTPIPPGNDPFNTPEPFSSRYEGEEEMPMQQDVNDDPFVEAMIRQAQVGIFVLPGKPVHTA